jgi:hypothetical protein
VVAQLSRVNAFYFQTERKLELDYQELKRKAKHALVAATVDGKVRLHCHGQ